MKTDYCELDTILAGSVDEIAIAVLARAISGAGIAKFVRRMRRLSDVRSFMEVMEPRRLLAAGTIRIDVGGDGHTETSGKVWQADRGFTGGTASSAPFGGAGTSEDALLSSRRFGDFS